MNENNFKEKWIEFINQLQDKICKGLEDIDGTKFLEESWIRDEGGGGRTRVMDNGNVFEKGGVNTSVVFGDVTPQMQTQLKIHGAKWFACGLSLVIHPKNPFVPTVHCNYRMFELYDENDNVIDRWFGGGTDLTPYYLIEEDAVWFHRTYKTIADKFDVSFYPEFKKICDDYFVNYHRNNERRGVGGIFYDHQRPSKNKDLEFWFNFSKACGEGFLEAYLPIVERRKDMPYNEDQKFWQEVKRGRYVEFNLLHDRGTIFGLKTNGRTESILMSLPPTVRFIYNYQPEAGSEEEKIQIVCLNPVDWV